jgi:hypothetical protein
MSAPALAPAPTPAAERARRIERDGIVSLPGLLSPEWGEAMRADYEVLLREATGPEGGSDAIADRGTCRIYQAVFPERLRGVQELMLAPALHETLVEVLGEDFQLVEVAFDTPLPGATDQPPHRDFPRTTSEIQALAVNFTTTPVTDECAPFAYVPGTHHHAYPGLHEGRCLPRGRRASFLRRAVRGTPMPGDVSIRTPLMVHWGTANRTSRHRSVGIVGAVRADLPGDPAIGIVMTRDYLESWPAWYRRHLTRCQIVDELPTHAKSRFLNCIAGG